MIYEAVPVNFWARLVSGMRILGAGQPDKPSAIFEICPLFRPASGLIGRIGLRHRQKV